MEIEKGLVTISELLDQALPEAGLLPGLSCYMNQWTPFVFRPVCTQFALNCH
jgi:hypothetical protein